MEELLVLNGNNGKQVDIIPISRKRINNEEISIGPGRFAIDKGRNLIYLTNSISMSVSVINGATNKVISDIIVNYSPAVIAINPTNNKLGSRLGN